MQDRLFLFILLILFEPKVIIGKFTWKRIALPQIDNNGSSFVSPSARGFSGFGYDILSGNCIIYGGIDEAGNSLDDTWIFKISSGKFAFS